MAPRNGNGNGNGSTAGIFVSWAVLTMIGAMVASLVAGAIQLGAVQTHVQINTAKLDQVLEHDIAHSERLAKIDARQQINETRIGTLEMHSSTRDEFAAWKENRQQLLDSLQKQVDGGVTKAEMKAVIDSLRREIDQLDKTIGVVITSVQKPTSK